MSCGWQAKLARRAKARLLIEFTAKDIPDFGLLRGAQRIAVRSDLVPVPLGRDALLALAGYELRLISTAEAHAEAERTQASVFF